MSIQKHIFLPISDQIKVVFQFPKRGDHQGRRKHQTSQKFV
ncbi:hypothetical protein SPLC1_S130520 [Arthrospira platensis C1]|nr:hypothetical protein SPLC1_S130520 [Arthrospira platensis C1]